MFTTALISVAAATVATTVVGAIKAKQVFNNIAAQIPVAESNNCVMYDTSE